MQHIVTDSDPLAGAIHRYELQIASINASRDLGDEELDRLVDRADLVLIDAVQLPVATMAGALAVLRLFVREHWYLTQHGAYGEQISDLAKAALNFIEGRVQKPITRRYVMAGSAAAVAVVPALALPAFANAGEDAELRQLWAKYLVLSDAAEKFWAAHREQRDQSGFAAEIEELGHTNKNFDLLWKKHGMEPLYAISLRDDRKQRRVVKAIRKAKAESLFGIGVKLSAWEDWGHISEEEFTEVIDSVRRDIAALTGVDFIAATDALEA